MASKWSEYLANGIPVAEGETIPNRKEIRSLTDAELYVYVKGLRLFYDVDKQDPLSYFQIAGIHGLPYENWPTNKAWNDIPVRKVDPNPNAPERDFGGFCTHSSILFLTWHRPYLALFESALYKHVQEAARLVDDQDPLKSEYLAAAKSFRMPYWDWALPRDIGSVFPLFALTDDGLPGDIKSKAKLDYNPLFKYVFPAGDGASAEEQAAWDALTYMGKGEVVRYPLGRQPSHGEKGDMENALETFFAQQESTLPPPGQNLTERITYLLQGYSEFGPFSHNRYFPPTDKDDPTMDANKYGSVEDVHNYLHDLIGGGGQMGDPATSAFDPIFWLHHTNIDRLLAIWQGLWQDDNKADTWVTPQPNGKANIVQLKKDEQTVLTKLYPFRPTPTTWYDSNTMKQTKDFGYYYPETAGTTYPIDETAKTALRAKITALYPSPARLFVMSKKGLDGAEKTLLPKAEIVKSVESESAPVAVTAATSRKLKDLIPANDKYLEWLVNIKAEKHALGGDYSVFVFLGPPDDAKPSQWQFSPLYVGAFYPFGQSNETSCANCRDAQRDHTNITGQIPLTLALMERYLVDIIPDMQHSTVVEYLKVNLHWRVRKNGRKLDNRSDVDGLKVFVVTNEVTLPEHESRLPDYAYDVTPVLEITTKEDGSGGRGEGTGLTNADVPSAP